MVKMSILEKIKSKLLQKDVVDFYESKPLVATNKKAKKLLPLALVALASGAIGALYGLPRIRDRDGDGLSDWYEEHLGTDPNKPNPNVAYALKNGLDEKYVDLIKPLDSDGKMQFEEKKWVGGILHNQKMLELPTFLSYLEKQSSDGTITREEMLREGRFEFMISYFFDTVEFEKRVMHYKIRHETEDIDYAANLALRLKLDDERHDTAEVYIAVGEYALAVKEETLPERINNLEALIDAIRSAHGGSDLLEFQPDYPHDEFNIPFGVWLESEIAGHDKVSVEEYPWALNQYVKQVDEIIYQDLRLRPGMYKWDELENALIQYWKFHVEINEKNERALPLEKKAVMELFKEPIAADIVERNSFLNGAELREAIAHTDELVGACKDINELPTEEKIDAIIDTLNKMPELHNLVMHILRYRADDGEQLYEFLREQGFSESLAASEAKFYAQLLDKPDPIKMFIILWNKSTTDQADKTKLVEASAPYKEIMINEGIPLKHFDVKFRGNEELSPQDQSADWTGIAPIRFQDGRNVTFENVGEILTGMGIYAHSGHEEARVEASVLLGHSIGYPLTRVSVEYKDPELSPHKDTGIFLTDAVYEAMKEKFGDQMLDLEKLLPVWGLSPYITNGWVFDKELAERDLKIYETGESVYDVMGVSFKDGSKPFPSKLKLFDKSKD